MNSWTHPGRVVRRGDGLGGWRAVFGKHSRLSQGSSLDFDKLAGDSPRQVGSIGRAPGASEVELDHRWNARRYVSSPVVTAARTDCCLLDGYSEELFPFGLEVR